MALECVILKPRRAQNQLVCADSVSQGKKQKIWAILYPDRGMTEVNAKQPLHQGIEQSKPILFKHGAPPTNLPTFLFLDDLQLTF